MGHFDPNQDPNVDPRLIADQVDLDGWADGKVDQASRAGNVERDLDFDRQSSLRSYVGDPGTVNGTSFGDHPLVSQLTVR